jgi:high-affinity Fe2+/Pb2+ permease
MGFVTAGLLFTAATVYYAVNPDYGWVYALLFTALPAAVGVVFGVREIVLARQERPPTES